MNNDYYKLVRGRNLLQCYFSFRNMVDRVYPELNEVGTSYLIPRPDLGVTFHLTEPLLNHDHNYETRFPGLKLPFGLSINQFPKYKALLELDPTLTDPVNVMMYPPLAISTISTYTPSVRKIGVLQISRISVPSHLQTNHPTLLSSRLS